MQRTHHAHPGLFVAFEGGEGAGKSTQIAQLHQHLVSTGHQVTCTREPGANTSIGALLRTLLLDPTVTDLDDRAEALLFAADRAQHVATTIAPALAAGQIVLTDRYVDSSLVYQGVGRSLGVQAIRDLSTFAADGLVPDLTIVLDLPPAVGLARARSAEIVGKDRIEAADLAFHTRVRAGFLSLATPDRHVVVDATQPPTKVSAAVWAAVAPRLHRPGHPRRAHTRREHESPHSTH